MVNPAMIFSITIDGEPLGHISFKLFADRPSGCMASTYVVSGKVKEGMNVAEATEGFGSRNGKTSKITIADGGQL
ncbi:hypothetical protein P7K49_028602 [Saguinus oedipus]|uniref:PPIase cyclophilin-type domain-containing protein n=1 Tax=Saguinus oedipus TaxID=9490 RepID=A0ABQ9U4T7_SAGOE|nr:hypothetical protein P7K49_028602 [Saguinus oedipus]